MTRSPGISSPACRHPPGVRTRWFSVAANWASPFFPDFATLNWRNSSALPLLNQFTIRRGTIRPVSGSYERTSTSMRWLTIFPIFSWVPSARVTRVEYDMHPNMTPTFSRSWLMKIAVVLVWLSAPVILRRAWDMSRAWSPT